MHDNNGSQLGRDRVRQANADTGHDSVRHDVTASFATSGAAGSARGPTGVGDLITAAFNGVPEQATADDRLVALNRIAQGARDMSAVERAALRQEVTDRLRATGVNARESADLARATMRTAGAQAARTLQGAALDLHDAEPWEEPVDGSELADAIARLLSSYLVLDDAARDAVVLWIIFTYVIGVVDVAPRLLVTSPVKACGKTRLLTLLAALTRRGLPGSSITTSVVFRVIEAHFPTLLLDEIDNLRLNEKQELLAILNSGHTRGSASVLRTVGDDHELRSFSTWCAIAMAGIRTGSLPDTATSRAIRVTLGRKRRGEVVARMREGRLYAELEPFRRKLARWASDHAQEVGDADPQLPGHLDGRVADNWSVMIAIGDALGGSWATRSRNASRALEGREADDEGVSEMLLLDLREIFTRLGADRLTSEQAITALAAIEGRPWAEWGSQHKPISANQLARLLKGFGIVPGSIRLAGGRTAKGYYREQFADAWERYLPPGEVCEPSHRHDAELARLNRDAATVTASPTVRVGFELEPALAADCDGVTVPGRPMNGTCAVPPDPDELLVMDTAPVPGEDDLPAAARPVPDVHRQEVRVSATEATEVGSPNADAAVALPSALQAEESEMAIVGDAASACCPHCGSDRVMTWMDGRIAICTACHRTVRPTPDPTPEFVDLLDPGACEAAR